MHRLSGYSRGKIGKAAFYIAAVGALVADQVSKAAARHVLEFGHKVEVVPGFFSLRLVENPGAAFGLMGSWPPLLILIGLAAVLAVFALRKERAKSKLLAVALGLLLGGALGNLIDRIVFGPVTDFLDFGVSIAGRMVTWPTFNVADIAIVVGVVMLMCHTIIAERERGGKSASAPAESHHS